jgi:hypothetical protein
MWHDYAATIRIGYALCNQGIDPDHHVVHITVALNGDARQSKLSP